MENHRAAVALKTKYQPDKMAQKTYLNAILYQRKNGCNWYDLPKDFPPFQTVYHYYSQWCKDGTFDKIEKFCHQQPREKVGKNPNYSSLIMVDSQPVKNTCTAGKDTYKLTNGIERQLSVDSIGFSFFVHCSKPSLSNVQRLIEVFTEHINFFKLKLMNKKKITILVD